MPDSGRAASDGERSTPLRHHPLFDALSSTEIERLIRRLRRVAFAPSTVFVHEGEPGDCVYVLVTGSVEILKALDTPEERSFGLLGPGDILGEMSLLDPDQPRSASVRCRSAVEALVITREDFDELLAEHPGLSLDLLRIQSQRLRSSENATIHDLQAKNQELRAAYRELEAAQEQLVEQAVLARELAQAQRIQLQMLPARLPDYPGVAFGAAIRAARSVGGDLYEVIGLDAERVALVIGDVAGKGMPAALYMALVSSLLRAEARPGVRPETVVRRVNRHLFDRDMDSMFVTLLYCQLNLRTRRLQLVRAGHERPLLWIGQEPAPLAEGGRALPLGLVAEPVLDVQKVTLPAAATFLTFTDGVTDAMDQANQPFGRSRLIETVAGNLQLSAQPLCDAIMAAVLEHQGAMPQFDDVTLLALRLD
jgi:serine phosphatase RsbU (regulator of sigma subunit)